MKEQDIKTGDLVSWQTSQGKTTGEVVAKITRPTKIKGHKVEASKDEPQFRVRSHKTGAEAAHKAEALKKC
jgi:hypothetical protein